jgi:hypothetical protein
MEKYFLIVIADSMEILDDFLGRCANSLEGCEIKTDNRIPFVVIRSKNSVKMEKMRQYITILMIKDFLGRITFLDKKDLLF